MITFVVIPFGDSISIGGHTIDLQAADLNAGALYMLATIGARRVRRGAGGMGVEQSMGAARRDPRDGADDLVRDRDGPRDRRRWS